MREEPEHGTEPGLLHLDAGGPVDLERAEDAPVAVLHAEGTRPPLVLVRSWSRELAGIRSLARHLGADQPLYAIGPPCPPHPDDHPSTVESWTDFCRARWDAIPPAPRVVLGGWSFGGVLALHLAERLVAEGRDVALVAMMDTRLPKSHPKDQRPVLHKLLHHLDEALDLPRGQRLGYLRERARWQIRPHVERLRRSLGRRASTRRARPASTGDEAEVRREKPPLMRAIWIAYLKYRPRPIRLPVLQLWCEESRDHVDDATLGWAPHLRGPMECVPVPGSHFTLFDEPHVAALAARLDDALRRVGASRQPALASPGSRNGAEI
jgi:thioesterase domain-containing protein